MGYLRFLRLPFDRRRRIRRIGERQVVFDVRIPVQFAQRAVGVAQPVAATVVWTTPSFAGKRFTPIRRPSSNGG